MYIDWDNIDWQAVEAISAMCAVLISVVGFGALIYQARQVERALAANAHNDLYTHDITIMSHFVDKPWLFPYFYQNKDVRENDKEYSTCYAVAELLAAHFEHLFLQRSNLPADVSRRWKIYMESIYENSPVLRRHLEDSISINGEDKWYIEEIYELGKTKATDDDNEAQ